MSTLQDAEIITMEGLPENVKQALGKAFACPVCRSNMHACFDDKVEIKALMKRVDAGHHEAMRDIGTYYFKGEMGLRQDKAGGLKWYHRAVEAGSGMAAFSLGAEYHEDDGVDKYHHKALEYYQKSTELGYIPAFPIVGAILLERGEIEEAYVNFRKAAMCGLRDEHLFKTLRYGFLERFITKDEYAYTLRENQKACTEMRSADRERAMAMLRTWVL